MKRDTFYNIVPFITGILMLPLLSMPVSAAGLKDALKDELKTTGNAIGVTSEVSVEYIIGNIINYAMLLIGTLFFALIVYGGYLWMTAHGAADQVKKAREVIVESSIGLALVLGAWGISYYILFAALKSTGLL